MTHRTIGRYEIRKELGRGGMATVFRAYDPRFEREVAVKVMPRELLHDPMFRARFEREAKTIAKLEQPAIVPVYDFGEHQGQPYLVMRLMTGGSLEDRLKSGALALAEATAILSHIASSLDEAHARGIIHRDLKPGNILFDQSNRPYISDFGIVKLSEATQKLSHTNAIIGTPAYMSPEQAYGDRPVDRRSDIYALGVILFEMLTGQVPYLANTPIKIMMKHIHDPIPDVRRFRSNLPPASQAIIAQAMAKHPDHRFATVSQMADALTRIAPSQATSRQQPASVAQSLHHRNTPNPTSHPRQANSGSYSPLPIPPPPALPTQGPRSPILIGLIAAVALLLLAGSMLLFVSGNDNQGDEIAAAATQAAVGTQTAAAQAAVATQASAATQAAVATQTAAAQAALATQTAVPPTAVPPTAVPPTAVVPPTGVVPPTAVPPTAVPPTAVPPTAVPPTAVPPTAVPPTAVPPTAVPPTAVPPTAVPPTAVPPTAVPPTAVPPTAVPPTAVPPTAVPPTAVPPTVFAGYSVGPVAVGPRDTTINADTVRFEWQWNGQALQPGHSFALVGFRDGQFLRIATLDGSQRSINQGMRAHGNFETGWEWYVVVVDGGGNEVSPRSVTLRFNISLGGDRAGDQGSLRPTATQPPPATATWPPQPTNTVFAGYSVGPVAVGPRDTTINADTVRFEWQWNGQALLPGHSFALVGFRDGQFLRIATLDGSQRSINQGMRAHGNFETGWEWYVVVVDGGGNEVSPRSATLRFNISLGGGGSSGGNDGDGCVGDCERD